MSDVTVYRFTRLVDGRRLTPKHMWGTLDSIAQLQLCMPIFSSARRVDDRLLEAGFLFESTPNVYLDIEDPARAA